MVRVKVLQANNDLGLESLTNNELVTIQEEGGIIIGVQFQHTAVVMGEGTRPSYAAMITYDDLADDNLEYQREEYEIDVPVQRD